MATPHTADPEAPKPGFWILMCGALPPTLTGIMPFVHLRIVVPKWPLGATVEYDRLAIFGDSGVEHIWSVEKTCCSKKFALSRSRSSENARLALLVELLSGHRLDCLAAFLVIRDAKI